MELLALGQEGLQQTAMPKAPPRLRRTLSSAEAEAVFSGFDAGRGERGSGVITSAWPTARTTLGSRS